MIDVLDKIKPLLIFEDEDDFYYLQILQRKKENPHLGSNSHVIKNYYISSVEYLESRYEEIKKMCVLFNARAMLRLNKRSYRKVAFKALQNIANTMSTGEYSFIKKSYDRACGLGHNDRNKTWIVDLDGELDKEDHEKMVGFINNSEPVGDKIIMLLPTKNGHHLLTRPFNLMNFTRLYSHVDIQKDNPVNIFIP